MHCTSCNSQNLCKAKAQVALHFTGLENLDKPQIHVSSEIAVCLDCGVAQFYLPEAELRMLGKRNADDARWRNKTD